MCVETDIHIKVHVLQINVYGERERGMAYIHICIYTYTFTYIVAYTDTHTDLRVVVVGCVGVVGLGLDDTFLQGASARPRSSRSEARESQGSQWG